jgi:flagellar biosynthesis protein FliQ
MTIDTVTSIINDAVQVIIIASLPSTMLGLLIGLLIAVFQAVTQIQEQTLTFVPKMIVMLLVISMTFSWMSHLVMDFSYHLWSNIPVYSK